jgi:sterol desaturase/sphingolipid hydroxylase (fatty acid hydroxylase superfamily)
MLHLFVSLGIQCATILKDAILVLILPADILIGLAILTKGLNGALVAAKRAAGETRFNLTLYILDSLFVGPIVIMLYALMANFADAFGLRLISPHIWNTIPSPLVGIAAVVAGDFIGYWRHRLEHTRFLWPAHAVHHSDTEMTWLALFRFHPINRITTFVIDNSFLLILGFPGYGLLVYFIVKHHYGIFIHADLPWRYGRIGRVFVSPVMHRWHHSIDPAAHQTNFATIFSAFDRMFGTYRVPALPSTALGVESHAAKGIVAQLLHPFNLSAYRVSPIITKERPSTHREVDQTSTDRGPEHALSGNERPASETYRPAVLGS